MKIAYLIDKDTVGGGCEYIRQLQQGLPQYETKDFFASGKDCRARVINAWTPDIIHVNHLKALLQLFADPFCRPCAPVIFTVHGIHLRKFDFLPRTFVNRLKRFLRLRLERWLYVRCKRLVALTPTDADYLRKVHRVQIPISVIANGVTVTPEDETVPLRYRKGGFMFISIARFNFQKGQDVLLNAIARQQKALRLLGRKTLFIGAGETFGEMKRFAEARGISDLVEFAGEIPSASRYLDCGRILIAPSRWEGLPLLILEAGLRGKCVIASGCPGNRDVISDGVSGLLFPVEDGDSLSKLLIAEFSDEEVDRLGQNLSDCVRMKFSVGQMLHLTDTIYMVLNKSASKCEKQMVKGYA